jgi:hypothetical protein
LLWAGDLHAIKELLDRCLGRPTANVEITQAEAVERIEEMTDDQLMAIASGTAGGGE